MKVVNQPPNLAELYDDKHFVNNLLSSRDFCVPSGWTLNQRGEEENLEGVVNGLEFPYPVVAKPLSVHVT